MSVALNRHWSDGTCEWVLWQNTLHIDGSARQLACGRADTEQLARQAAESVRRLMEGDDGQASV